MKSIFVVVCLVACAFAQRIHIKEPANNAKVKSGEVVTFEIQQDETTSSFKQTSLLIAVGNCNDNCNKPSPAEVIYSGKFNPQHNSSAPQKGLYQDFHLKLPELSKGKAVVQVAHQYGLGARFAPQFEYTTLELNIH